MYSKVLYPEYITRYLNSFGINSASYYKFKGNDPSIFRFSKVECHFDDVKERYIWHFYLHFVNATDLSMHMDVFDVDNFANKIQYLGDNLEMVNLIYGHPGDK